MMKKSVIIAVLLVFLVMGCDQFRTSKATKTGAFIGGTKGLDVGFAKDEPPAQVLDSGQQDFFITLVITNQGEFSIPNGGIIASLSGIAREALGLSNLNARSNFILDGSRKTATGTGAGGVEELQFGKATYKPDLPADFSLNLRADVCYDYETNAVATLCLRRNVLQRETTQEVCDVNTQAPNLENSGAPMQVQNLQARGVALNKIRVSFDVVNAGGGLVYSINTFSNFCGGNEDKKDNVLVGVTMPGSGARISCSRLNGNAGTVRLVDNIKTITCDIDTSGLQETTFEDLLRINLKYTYRGAVTVPIQIKDAASF